MSIKKAIVEGNLSAPLPETYFSGETWSRIRASAFLRPLTREIVEEAEQELLEPVQPLPFSRFRLFEDSGERYDYEILYFKRRARLLSLTMASLIEQSPRYGQALEDTIWEICGEYTWCLPAHLPHGLDADRRFRLPPPQVVDLFNAETAHALAEAWYMTRRFLHSSVGTRIKEEVGRRVFEPLFARPEPFDWESWPDNWAAVCAGASGMAALLLIDDRETIAGMMDRVIRSMSCFLEGYGSDGGCAEGIAYWNYGFGYFVYFAEMLFEYTGGSLDLLRARPEKIKRIAEFPVGIATGTDSFANFSDAPVFHVLNTGLNSRLHKRLNTSVPEMTRVSLFHADNCYRFAHVARNLLWTDESILHRPYADGSFHFPDLSLVLNRCRAEGGTIAFAAKGGHNDEPHNHNDLGHFVLHAGGDALFADLGAGLYTKEYFGKERYGILFNAAEGHSVPVLNGRAQTEGRSREASVREVRYSENAADFSLDLTKAYARESGIEVFTRTFMWKARTAPAEGELEIEDSFAFGTGSNTVDELFISLLPPGISRGCIELRGKHASAFLHYDAGFWDPRIEKLTVTGHDKQELDVYRIRLAGTVREGTLLAKFKILIKL